MRAWKLEYSSMSVFTLVHLILPPVSLATGLADVKPLTCTTENKIKMKE
jgi:hypothetical protein